MATPAKTVLGVPRGDAVWLVYLAFLAFQPLFDPASGARDWAIVALAVALFVPVYGFTHRVIEHAALRTCAVRAARAAPQACQARRARGAREARAALQAPLERPERRAPSSGSRSWRRWASASRW